MSKLTKLQKLIGCLLDTPPRICAQLIQKRIYGIQSLDAFDEKHPIIFVLSTGRVGSETLSALLSLSPNVISFHEPKPYLYRMSKCAYQNNSNSCDSVFYDTFLSLRSDLIHHALELGKGYVETSPQATFLAPIIYRVIPEVKFIHLIRHPADVIRSGMRRGWYLNHPADKNRIIPGGTSEFVNKWSDMSQLSKNIWLWTETNHYISEFLSIVPDNKKLLLHSEDVFSSDELTLQKLYGFVSSKIPSDSKINKILSKKLNRQKQGYFPRHKDWNDEELSELMRMSSKLMNKFNYSLDLKIDSRK